MTRRYTDRGRKEELQSRIIRGGTTQLTTDQANALGEIMGMLAAAECDADYHRRIVHMAGLSPALRRQWTVHYDG